jgi:DNA-directed RNA polymerase sigma subunit (sigma70/sigma32)
LFQKGHPTAEKLNSQKQKELLNQLLESLEPRETEVIMGIFNKDLGVRGLTVKFVRDYIPSLLS